MQASNSALNILESDGPSLGTISTVSVLRETFPASTWRRPSPFLSSAVQRSCFTAICSLKRTIDIVFSSILIILLFPVMLAVAIAVTVTSPGPSSLRKRDWAGSGYRFRIIKFRSMYSRKHKDNVQAINVKHHEIHRRNEQAYPLNKETPDPRITPVGRIIRKLSLDELPQLFNVLKGDMSLVGPRPIVEAEIRYMDNSLPTMTCSSPESRGCGRCRGGAISAMNGESFSIVSMQATGVARWISKILTRTIPAVITMRGTTSKPRPDSD